MKTSPVILVSFYHFLSCVVSILATPADADVWPENRVTRAAVTHGKAIASELADVGVKPAAVWNAEFQEGGSPAVLELEWPRPVAFDVMVLRWRQLPRGYRATVRQNGKWVELEAIRDNLVARDKFHCFQYSKSVQAVDGFRLEVSKAQTATAAVAIDSIELLMLDDLPVPIAEFVDQQTPRLFGLPQDATRSSRRMEDHAPDKSLLSRDIPDWMPIPISEYAKEGKQVNPLNTAHVKLLAELREAYYTTGHAPYAQRAWDVLKMLHLDP